MGTSKEPIRLRQRKTQTGLVSLYLDIYQDGKRSYEYLKLYLVPEKTRADKEKNRETMRLAETIKSKRLVELHNGEYGFKDEFSEDANFWDYYNAMCETRRGEETLGNWGNWFSAKKHMKKYDPKIEKRTFKEITPKWVEGFRTYLLTKAYAFGNDERNRVKDARLSKNSCVSYFNKLRACLNHAYENRVIRYNPARGIEGIHAEEGTRMYLTIDEVRRLADTPCEKESVRRAFLFSCLTGLRRSDIEKMTWSEVQQQGGFTRIIFKQKKTKGQEYLDITPQAAELIGERGQVTDNVFEDFGSPSNTNECIKRWVYRAGIQKLVTFHCGRHTFATMMLDIGTDIYTVSKLLGHRELNTTQIYAKVLDKSKQTAVSSIPNILPKEDEHE